MAETQQKQLYTCITCQIAFANPEHQRAHYKTDWHRYNLKRKVAELPPVTAAVFQEKVIAQKTADAHEMDKKQSRYCEVCHKTFANKNSLESHERSRKHREMAERKAKTSDRKPTSNPKKGDNVERTNEEVKVNPDSIKETNSEPDEEEEGDPLDTTECLFCPNYEDNMEASLAHMSKAHGFFIPDLEYLVDLEGLVEYLGGKVGVANLCLYCNERGKHFYTVEAVQHHMVDKGHCKLMFEGDSALEYADFYDYSKSYPNNGDDSKDTPITDNPLTINEGLELVLPSGMVAGHRCLKSYYKQHLRAANGRKKSSSVSRVMAQYRSLGWNGSCDDHGKRQRDEKWAQKMKQQKMLNVSVRANKMQFHFRPQVVF